MKFSILVSILFGGGAFASTNPPKILVKCQATVTSSTMGDWCPAGTRIGVTVDSTPQNGGEWLDISIAVPAGTSGYINADNAAGQVGTDAGLTAQQAEAHQNKCADENAFRLTDATFDFQTRTLTFKQTECGLFPRSYAITAKCE